MGSATKSDSVKTFDRAEIRCSCGQLLARWVAGGIQLKCKRCRRVVTIVFPASTT